MLGVLLGFEGDFGREETAIVRFASLSRRAAGSRVFAMTRGK